VLSVPWHRAGAHRSGIECAAVAHRQESSARAWAGWCLHLRTRKRVEHACHGSTAALQRCAMCAGESVSLQCVVRGGVRRTRVSTVEYCRVPLPT
jgi:hypothetical protein